MKSSRKFLLTAVSLFSCSTFLLYNYFPVFAQDPTEETQSKEQQYAKEWSSFAASKVYRSVRNHILSEYTSLGEYAWAIDAAELGVSQVFDYVLNGNETNFSPGSYSEGSVDSISSYVGIYLPSDSDSEILFYSSLPFTSYDKFSSTSIVSLPPFTFTLSPPVSSLHYMYNSSNVIVFTIRSRYPGLNTSLEVSGGLDSSPLSLSLSSGSNSFFSFGAINHNLSIFRIPNWSNISSFSPYFSTSTSSRDYLSLSPQPTLTFPLSFDPTDPSEIPNILKQISELYPGQDIPNYFPEYDPNAPLDYFDITDPVLPALPNASTFPTLPEIDPSEISIIQPMLQGSKTLFGLIGSFIKDSGLLPWILIIVVCSIAWFFLRW